MATDNSQTPPAHTRDSRRLFEELTTRKPAGWDQLAAVGHAALTPAQKAALDSLPVLDAPGSPMADINPAPPLECVLVRGGARYYVNTEGYTYARYVVRIDGWEGHNEPRAVGIEEIRFRQQPCCARFAREGYHHVECGEWDGHNG